MFIVGNYVTAVIFCFVTMLCWGSWGNTQKLAAKSWRYELFYWDYVIGMVLFALLIALTMGSFGSEGRPFLEDIAQLSSNNLWSIILGGVIFNASNILLSASTSIAGLAVAFPLGVGISLVLGTIVNYIGAPKGDPVMLFIGVALIVVAIICNGVASGKLSKGGDSKSSRKGIILAVVAGTLMAFFYRFVASAMDLDNFSSPAPGKATLGTAFSYIASGKAGAAISYALGQGAPMVAAIWGVFIWKEFKGASKGVYALLGVMFCLFLGGLGFIIISGN